MSDTRNRIGLSATAHTISHFPLSDQGKNFVAFDSESGTPLWHSRLQNVSNAPETFLLDDHQYVLVAADDMLYAFTLY
jgi:alcohol dehydrogenase (cytochrome c)